MILQINKTDIHQKMRMTYKKGMKNKIFWWPSKSLKRWWISMMKNVPNYCHIEDMKDEPKSHLAINGEWFAAFIQKQQPFPYHDKNIGREKKKRHKKSQQNKAYKRNWFATLNLVQLKNLKLTFVFLLLCGSSEALPWQGSCNEVHQDVSEGFHVVASGLFDALRW